MRNSRSFIAALTLVMALVLAAGAQAQSGSALDVQTPSVPSPNLPSAAESSGGALDAVTAAKQDLMLGFTVPGKVLSAPVKAGDVVEKGQVLLELDDREGKVMVDRLELRLRTEAEVQSRQERLNFAKLKEAQLRELRAKSAASQWELQTAEVETRIAALELELAVQGHEDLAKQLEQAQARHEQFVLIAPAAGVIEQVAVEEGELVEASKPVLRLVVTDPLWVDVAVPTQQTLTLQVGGSAMVRSKLSGYDQPMKGRIIHLAAVADAASDTRLVRVEVPNSNNLPAGGHVTVSFEASGLAAAGTTQTPVDEGSEQ